MKKNTWLGIGLAITAMTTFVSSAVDAFSCGETRWDRNCGTHLTGAQYSDGCGCFNGYVGVEYLYWTVHESGLDYARDTLNALGGDNSSVSGHSGVGDDIAVNCTHFLKHDWTSGFRIKAGIILDHDCWDIWAEYMYLRPHASDCGTPGTECGETNTFMVPMFWTQANDRLIATKIKAKLDVDFDQLDIMLGRSYFLSCGTAFKPFAGIRALWMDEKFRYKLYGAGSAPDFPTEDVSDCSSIAIDTKYWGVGARMGMRFDWNFGCTGLGLYTRLAGSILAGREEMHHVIQDGAFPEVDLKDKFDNVRPALDGGIGLQWEGSLECFCSYLVFYIGYEFEYLFNTPQQHRWFGGIDAAATPSEVHRGIFGLSNRSDAGHFGMHGLTIGGEINF